MYEETYGTGWSTLSTEEIMERAFALGVATALGETHSREVARLRAETGSRYEQQMVQLAFDEGRTRGATMSADGDVSMDEVWQEMVVDTEIEIHRSSADGDEADDEEDASGTDGGSVELSRPADRPTRLLRIEVVETRTSDSREQLGIPDFLR
ncbi:MAG: hypothetical protein R3324_04160 [Halobacteriales archaeon]|nr:hypothetical protein [Halobacteriales archaeon]